MKRLILLLFAAVAVALLTWYIARQSARNRSWSRTFKGLGTNSSPRAVDLNRDGVLDIVLGAGGEEFKASEGAVLALDGSTGETLWTVSGINQMVGSAVFKDITGDGTPDVFIGGRSAQFYAIDGLTGNLIWQYRKPDSILDVTSSDTTLLNFFNPQFIPDQNEDGVEDILTTFGGYVHAQPGDLNRPAGKLMILDALSGRTLKESMSPDGKEIYMSPVVYDFGEGPTILFGTGGETIVGNFYSLRLGDFVTTGMKHAKAIDTGHTKGFIAPPVIADITGDGTKDILVTTMDGYMKSYNGKNFSLIWSNRIHPRAEVQSMPTPLYFNDDKIPDFFNTFNLGEWPRNPAAIHVILSGVDGAELFRDTLGILQFSSAVTIDLNKDGFHDILYPINVELSELITIYQSQLMVYDGKSGFKTALDSLHEGKTLGSTPLITDLNFDGKADLVYTYMTQSDKFITYRDLVVKKINLEVPLADNPWGGYMGTTYNSVYAPRN